MTDTKNSIRTLSVLERLSQKLTQRQKKGYIRKLNDCTKYIDFCSNDYLGLANSALLKHSQLQLDSHTFSTPNGSTGSRLISGNLNQTEEAENFIATFHGAESGLIFNSGFDANIGMMSCIASGNDWIFYDEYAHTSLKDGIKLSRGHSASFKHNNLEDLAAKVANATGRKFVVVEAVYSMDGDLAPLTQLLELCKSFGAELIVDEAHAVGVYGQKGEGRVAELDIENSVFARTVTFGKAIGCNGAIVLGSKVLRQYLINYAHSFIYTTALPFHCLQRVQTAYRIMQNWTQKREKIRKLSSLLRRRLKPEICYAIVGDQPHIISILIPGNRLAKQLSARLLQQNIYVKAILFPTVPQGKERLRISIHSFNTAKQIEKLADTINRFTQ